MSKQTIRDEILYLIPGALPKSAYLAKKKKIFLGIKVRECGVVTIFLNSSAVLICCLNPAVKFESIRLNHFLFY